MAGSTMFNKQIFKNSIKRICEQSHWKTGKSTGGENNQCNGSGEIGVMVHTSYSFKISGFMMAWFFRATITASLFQMKNVITGSLKINVAGLQSDKDGKSSVVHVSV